MNNKMLGRTTAAVRLEAWYEKAEKSGLRGCVSLAKSFRQWNDYVYG